MSPLSSSTVAAALVMMAAHWLPLWLGFYLISRAPRSRASLFAAAAFICLSFYTHSVLLLLDADTVAAAVFRGKWLGGWEVFAPVLWLHAVLCLTGARLPRQRLLLVVAWCATAFIYLVGGFDTLIYEYWVRQPIERLRLEGFAPGVLYPLMVLQVCGTLALALWATLRARKVAAPVLRHSLAVMATGTLLLLLGSGLLYVNTYGSGGFLREAIFDPLLVLGAVLLAVSFVAYPGLVEGQLLRLDLRSSLLASCALMCAYAAIVLALGGSLDLLAASGWLVLGGFVFSGPLLGLADRLFYGAGARAARSGLRAAAGLAGAPPLDAAALSSQEARSLAAYLGTLDRAAHASRRLEEAPAQRLALLAREEFAAVRSALGLSEGWTPADGLDQGELRRHAREALGPRERQALALRYLGYSDKEMARLMGVRPGVPRSYLAAGKRKLGLHAGAPLVVFVFFSDLVDTDALPLLGDEDPCAAPSEPPGAEAPATGADTCATGESPATVAEPADAESPA